MKTDKLAKTFLTLSLATFVEILPSVADPIEVPNPGFEFRETYDPFPEGTDKYNQWGQESWRHFNLTANGGPLRIWNPGVPGVDETAQGIADVAFEGIAPEGKYVVVVRSRQNDPLRDFEAATQLLEETFDSSTAYTLTVQVGRLPNGEVEGGSANYIPDWFGYSVQFVVGGTNIDGASFAGQVVDGTVLAEDLNTLDVPVNGFVTSTVNYLPNPADAEYDGLPIQIRLCALETPINREDDSLAGWVAFDDVKLETGFFPPSAPIPFEITEISYSPGDGKAAASVSLTWRSRPGDSYIVNSSSDLTNWALELEDGITADEDENLKDGDQITKTFDLSLFGLEDEEQLFFRVEKQ